MSDQGYGDGKHYPRLFDGFNIITRYLEKQKGSSSLNVGAEATSPPFFKCLHNIVRVPSQVCGKSVTPSKQSS